MITCTLKDKKYAVDFISGRALREMEPAAKMYAQIVALSNAAVKWNSSCLQEFRAEYPAIPMHRTFDLWFWR